MNFILSYVFIFLFACLFYGRLEKYLEKSAFWVSLALQLLGFTVVYLLLKNAYNFWDSLIPTQAVDKFHTMNGYLLITLGINFLFKSIRERVL